MANEADTCRQYVLPKLAAAGWTDEQIGEQRIFTAGRILVQGRKASRAKPKRADYLLFYQPRYPLAVVEAKADYRNPADGMQQAKSYAETLGLLFAYATNGRSILEFDRSTGLERQIETFPSPQELWNRYRAANGLGEELEDKLLVPNHVSEQVPRYYQQIAINRAVEAILSGKRRVLLTLATGSGKTDIAFQIAWKLWNGQWNVRGAPKREPRILYLADRAILVNDPKDKTFAPFGDARWRPARRRLHRLSRIDQPHDQRLSPARCHQQGQWHPLHQQRRDPYPRPPLRVAAARDARRGGRRRRVLYPARRGQVHGDGAGPASGRDGA